MRRSLPSMRQRVTSQKTTPRPTSTASTMAGPSACRCRALRRRGEGRFQSAFSIDIVGSLAVERAWGAIERKITRLAVGRMIGYPGQALRERGLTRERVPLRRRHCRPTPPHALAEIITHSPIESEEAAALRADALRCEAW